METHRHCGPAFGDEFFRPRSMVPEELQKIMQEVPREPEVVALFDKIAGGERLPDR
jgi:hypothetical protein